MRPSFGSTSVAQAPTANDIATVRSGYAAGTGSVRTVEQDGIWVNSGFAGTQMGTQVNPVTSVWTAVDNFPPFAGFTVVHIAAGTYEEAGARTITDSMELRAESGVVTIR